MMGCVTVLTTIFALNALISVGKKYSCDVLKEKFKITYKNREVFKDEGKIAGERKKK